MAYIQPIKNVIFHLGPAIEISFVHDETKPVNANDNFTISEGLPLTPWIVAEGGYRILRPLELFVNSQYAPYVLYASIQILRLECGSVCHLEFVFSQELKNIYALKIAQLSTH